MTQTEKSLSAVLVSLGHFTHLTAEELAFLSAHTRRERYEGGGVLFLQDEPCHGMYVVESGLVRIFRVSPEGREQVLRLMRPGDAFNEVPIFDRGPNPASAQACVPTTVLAVEVDAVRCLLRSNPTVGEEALAYFATRLRHLVILVEDLSFRHVASRVARVLLQIERPAAGVGAGLDPGIILTQQELAALAGTAREVVARTLKEFVRVGIVRLDRGRIHVMDRDELERYAS
ncbi:MAG: Crp/Fnr family transcriptional regulator [Chloroflexi bacterium]|nr:Crp/Fnr family transcriptional regulator [Chloroflexota bacterium]